MNVLTSTYRASEMIAKDIFEYTRVQGTQLATTFSIILSLVPMIDELVSPIFELSIQRYKDIAK